MSRSTVPPEIARMRAEERFKRVEAQAAAAQQANLDQKAEVAARDAKTARLREARLVKEEADRSAAAEAKAAKAAPAARKRKVG